MLDQLLDYSPNMGLDTLILLPVLIALEAILSADNAIALAAIAQGLEGHKLQNRALNIGLVVAFVLRVGLILTATWVIRYWQFELAGAAYLLWLVFQHFISGASEPGGARQHAPKFSGLWQAIPMIAITDLAFSLDSVTTAIAISRDIRLVLIGGLVGVITLRFMAGLFIRWLDEFVYLEDAGFLTVALVGLRLLARVLMPDFVPPEWLMISAIGLLFAWGFSKRTAAQSEPTDATTPAPETAVEAVPESLTADVGSTAGPSDANIPASGEAASVEPDVVKTKG